MSFHPDHVLLVSVLLVAPLISGCVATPELSSSIGAANLDLAPDVKLEPVAGGLDRPVQFVADPRDEGRFLVAEMGGTVRLVTLADGAAADPWLNITDRLAGNHREQGLLGLALHPDADDARVFVTYTATNDDVVLASFDAPAEGPADNTTEKIILRVPQHKPYHNGGHIAFGPDGYLYAAFGDGSPQGDPDGNAQDLYSLLGTIIRIDVDQADGAGWGVPADNPFVDQDGRDEIWLYGLRNPWRFSFDAETGDLWIGDVGFLAVEEIDRVPRALGGGHNLGWPRWEGNQPFAIERRVEVPVLFPVHEYGRTTGACNSVTGGFVYRGNDVPDIRGQYLFADFCTGDISALRDTDAGWNDRSLVSTGLPIAGFGEGPDGALYVLSYAGSVYRLSATH